MKLHFWYLDSFIKWFPYSEILKWIIGIARISFVGAIKKSSLRPDITNIEYYSWSDTGPTIVKVYKYELQEILLYVVAA